MMVNVPGTPGTPGTPGNRIILWAPLLCIVALVAYYDLFLYTYAVNVPYTDDIWDVLQFLVNVQQSSGWTDTAAAFYEQHNVHRTLSSRIIYYLAYTVEGEANFRTLTLLANLSLPLILAMLYLCVHDKADKRLLPLVLLSSAFILFQLRTFEISFWTMAAFAYMSVFLYGIASILCLQNASPLRLTAGALCAALATFSLASGQLIWLVGLASLIYQATILKTAPKAYITWWTACAILILGLYYADYQSLLPADYFVSRFFAMPLTHIINFCTLLGSAVGQSSVLIATLAGIAMLTLTAYSTFHRFREKNLAVEFFAWYVILSAMSITLGRSVEGMEAVLSPLILRYIFPSVLLLAVMPVLLFLNLPAKWLNPKLFILLAVVSAVYSGYSYYAYSPGVQRHLEQSTGSHNLKRFWYYGSPGEVPTAMVKNAITCGIYNPKKRWYAKYQVSPLVLRVTEPELWVPPKKSSAAKERTDKLNLNGSSRT